MKVRIPILEYDDFTKKFKDFKTKLKNLNYFEIETNYSYKVLQISGFTPLFNNHLVVTYSKQGKVLYCVDTVPEIEINTQLEEYIIWNRISGSYCKVNSEQFAKLIKNCDKTCFNFIDFIFNYIEPEVSSHWIGKPGEKLEFNRVKVLSQTPFNGSHGWFTIVIFEHNNNLLQWITNTENAFLLQISDLYNIVAVISSHKTIDGKRITILTRVKVIKEY